MGNASISRYGIQKTEPLIRKPLQVDDGDLRTEVLDERGGLIPVSGEPQRGGVVSKPIDPVHELFIRGDEKDLSTHALDPSIVYAILAGSLAELMGVAHVRVQPGHEEATRCPDPVDHALTTRLPHLSFIGKKLPTGDLLMFLFCPVLGPVGGRGDPDRHVRSRLTEACHEGLQVRESHPIVSASGPGGGQSALLDPLQDRIRSYSAELCSLAGCQKTRSFRRHIPHRL